MTAVIDRSARRRLAEGLRRLAAGRITNVDFENRYARTQRSQDRSIGEIFGAAWHLYSDLETYRLIGRHRLDRKTRRDVARCIVFLHSNRPYEWPITRLWVNLACLPVHILTLGLSARIQNRRWRNSGDFEVWPFHRSSDYRSAIRTPVYLNRRPRGSPPLRRARTD